MVLWPRLACLKLQVRDLRGDGCTAESHAPHQHWELDCHCDTHVTLMAQRAQMQCRMMLLALSHSEDQTTDHASDRAGSSATAVCSAIMHGHAWLLLHVVSQASLQAQRTCDAQGSPAEAAASSAASAAAAMPACSSCSRSARYRPAWRS